MLPATLPRLRGDGVVLRDVTEDDAPLVAVASRDTLIPLITTVPAFRASATGPNGAAVAAYIARQRGRLAEGSGYSFAIADTVTHEAVGQIGLWTRETDAGRATTSCWIAQVGDERRDMWSYARVRGDRPPETG